jgi:hypothetical protein
MIGSEFLDGLSLLNSSTITLAGNVLPAQSFPVNQSAPKLLCKVQELGRRVPEKLTSYARVLQKCGTAVRLRNVPLFFGETQVLLRIQIGVARLKRKSTIKSGIER